MTAESPFFDTADKIFCTLLLISFFDSLFFERNLLNSFSKLESNISNIVELADSYAKTKKELDRLCSKDGISHQGLIAEIEHLEEFNIKDYINIAGGMTKNATKKYYIIQSSTGDRIPIKISSNYEFKSQDIIFIEEKKEYKFWDRFKDIVELTSQILTIIAVIITIQ